MKNLVSSKIVLFCLSIAVILTACKKENIDETETVVVSNNDDFDCADLEANVGDLCQDGWGIVTTDCDCVENVSEPDCPEFFFEGWSDGNYGSPCETPDVPLGGIISDDCECVEDENFCSDLIGGNANYPHGYIGDECWTTNDQQGIISENCECIEN